MACGLVMGRASTEWDTWWISKIEEGTSAEKDELALTSEGLSCEVDFLSTD